MRRGSSNINEQLDRALCNQHWLKLHLDATVRHLPRTRFDHVPLLLCSPTDHSHRHQPAQCCLSAAWFTHPSFATLVEQTWKSTSHADWQSWLEFLQAEVVKWKKFVFGNLADQKHRCRARLAGTQRHLCHADNGYLWTLEVQLQRKLGDILLREEVFWQEKSRITWLKEGEQNTRFFHLSTITRRWNNRVLGLKEPSG